MANINWYHDALLAAQKHPTIAAMRSRAERHRKEGQNFLNHGCEALRQHDEDADRLNATADLLEMEMVAKAGVAAGEFKAYAIGFNRVNGSYIHVETSQGWDPDPFWAQYRESEIIESTL